MKTMKMLLTLTIMFGAVAYACALEGASTSTASGLSFSPTTGGSRRSKHIKPTSSDEVKNLAKELREADRDTKSYVLEDLVSVSTDAVQLKAVYKELLDDKDENVQEAAVRVAAKMKMKDATPKIRAILKKQARYKISKARNIRDLKRAEDLGYTCEAAKALIELDDFDSVDEIISRDLFMMNSGGQFLAKFGAKVLPKVLQHANDGEMQKIGAKGAIHFMRDEAAAPELIDILNGTDASFASDAALALSAIADTTKSNELKTRIVSKLEGQLANKNAQVRMGVYGGLLAANPEKYGMQIFTALAKEDGVTQLNVMYDLSRYRVKGLGAFLEQFIKDDETRSPIDHDVRAAAARALYLSTGKKVEYKGLEEDQKRPYSNPYANK